MSHMPTARPTPTSMKTTGSRTTKLTAPLAPFRPGALLRVNSGETFRVSKDASRVHFASSHNRRNVLHLDSDGGTGACLPDHFVRALLNRIASSSAAAAGHRCWRAQEVDHNSWTISLELRGTSDGRLQFPQPAGLGLACPSGVPIDLSDLAGFGAVIDRLWSAADAYEADRFAPADLSDLRAALTGR